MYSEIHPSKVGFKSFQIETNPKMIHLHPDNPLQSMWFDEIFTRLTMPARAEIFRFSLELQMKPRTRLFLYAALQDYPDLKGEQLWAKYFKRPFEDSCYRTLKSYSRKIAMASIDSDLPFYMKPTDRAVQRHKAYRLVLDGRYEDCVRFMLQMGKLSIAERIMEIYALSKSTLIFHGNMYLLRCNALKRQAQREKTSNRAEIYRYLKNPSSPESFSFMLEQINTLPLHPPLDDKWTCPEWIILALKNYKRSWK